MLSSSPAPATPPRARARRRPTTRLLLAALCAAASLAAGLPAFAQEEIPVTLRARLVRYNKATNTMEASGDVVVIHADVTIRADRLRANLETGEVRAEGNASIEMAGRKMRGASLDFNLTARRGRVIEAAADYTGPMVLGTVFLRAGVIEGVLDTFAAARDASCTTCEGPTPVAYLTAGELTLYPNDKIVGRRVSLWIGGRRIVTWPQFVIFIRERRASRLLPVVGYSDYEGFFLKTFYSYVVNEDHYGYLRLDLMEKLGIGYGVEHTYRVPEGSGALFLYRLENRQTGGPESRVVATHQQRLGDVYGRLYLDNVWRDTPGARSVDSFASLDTYYHRPGLSATLYQSYGRYAFEDAVSSTYLGRVILSRQMSPALSAEVTADFSRASSSLGADDELLPRITLRYRGRGYSAMLVAEARIDLDGDLFPGDLRYMAERLPELSIAWDPRLLGGTRLVYQAQAGVGRFRETRIGGETDAVRTDGAVTISGPLATSERGYLSLRAMARGSHYTTGDARGFLSGYLGYSHTFSTAWQGQLSYTYQDQAGQSPFEFDRTLGRISLAQGSLTYRRPDLAVTVAAAYDGITGRASPVEARLQYVPRPQWAFGAAAAYDPSARVLSRAELSLDVMLNPRWHIGYYGYYDGTSGSVMHDRVSLTRIWDDCLATSITYRGAGGEVWLEAWLTALPWARGRIGVGSTGTLLFDQPWLPSPPR